MTPRLAQRPRVDRSFERLYRRHVADVYHYALAVLRNPADAEDVTQTTFLNAYGAYRRGERPAAPRNWLIAIAHNVCRQRFRQSARRPKEVAFDEDVGEALVADDGPSAQDIRTALGHLAFNQRAALVMRELEGRSYAEIAEILGVTVGAVETLIFRARRALREQLEGSLTCREAEVAISRQLDGRLPRPERGSLRAHLRACDECASFARSQRAQRAAVRAIAAIPLPGSLASFFGGGTAVGAGLAAKAAAVVAVGAVVGGVGYEGVKRLPVDGGGATAPAAAPEATPPATGGGPSVDAARLFEATLRVGPEGSRAASAARARGRAAGKDDRPRKAAKRAKATKPATPADDRARARGRSAQAPAGAKTPGRAKTRPTAGGGRSNAKPARTRATPPAAYGRDKPRRARAASSTRADQPVTSDPPRRAPKPPRRKAQPPLPVSTPAVSTPLPPPVTTPELPDVEKVKR